MDFINNILQGIKTYIVDNIEKNNDDYVIRNANYNIDQIDALLEKHSVKS